MRALIIIVTYNGMAWIQKCLDSCTDYPVVVVDNASTDETLAFIRENYPNVTLLAQEKNLGFGAANNLGMAYALKQQCDYVFLVNQDVYIENGCIDRLIVAHNKNDNYGILSPIHFNGKGNGLDANFSMFLKRYKTNEAILYDSFTNNLREVYPIEFVNAAAWLIPKKIVEEIGGFDPLFFHYGEDRNYCQRVWFHKYKIGIVTNAIIWHDRENRKSLEIIPYSDKFYKEYERYAKVEWADVNLSDFDKKYRLRQEKLSKKAVKNLLRLNLAKFKEARKKRQILSKLKPQLLKSRKKNLVKNNNNLD